MYIYMLMNLRVQVDLSITHDCPHFGHSMICHLKFWVKRTTSIGPSRY